MRHLRASAISLAFGGREERLRVKNNGMLGELLLILEFTYLLGMKPWDQMNCQVSLRG